MTNIRYGCMLHISFCNNIVLREYSNMLQQYTQCYNMLQHLGSITSLQHCSIAELQHCKNFNHRVHAPSGLSGREQALWAKQMHVMADWGVMRPICCVTSVPPPSSVKVLHTRSRYVLCMPERNGYLAKSRCCQIILSAARLLCHINALNFCFKFQSNLFSAHLFWKFARAAEPFCV